MSEYYIVEVPEGAKAGDTVTTLCELVRCRDCKHGYEVTWPAHSGIPADHLDCTGPLVETWDYERDEPRMNPVEPDGYCHKGERRSE